MDYKLLADTALLAGEIMLTSGAETYRVEETISRILMTSGLEKTEGLALMTSIIVTLEGRGVAAITLVKRIGERSTNLGNVYEVNEVSRKYCDGKITLEEAWERLNQVLGHKRYPGWLVNFCAIVTSASFTILLGGSFIDSIIAAFNGIFYIIGMSVNKILHVNRFIMNLIVSFFMATISVIIYSVPSLHINLDFLIAGSIMSMLPGVAITNAIRDTLQGDYMSGGARAMEAFVIATSIAVGIGGGLAFGGFLIGGIIT